MKLTLNLYNWHNWIHVVKYALGDSHVRVFREQFRFCSCVEGCMEGGSYTTIFYEFFFYEQVLWFSSSALKDKIRNAKPLWLFPSKQHNTNLMYELSWPCGPELYWILTWSYNGRVGTKFVDSAHIGSFLPSILEYDAMVIRFQTDWSVAYPVPAVLEQLKDVLPKLSMLFILMNDTLGTLFRDFSDSGSTSFLTCDCWVCTFLYSVKWSHSM